MIEELIRMVPDPIFKEVISRDGESRVGPPLIENLGDSIQDARIQAQMILGPGLAKYWIGFEKGFALYHSSLQKYVRFS